MTAEVLMATPCTKSVGCQSGGAGGHKQGRDEGRMLCWKCAAVSWSGAAAVDVDVCPERRSPRYHGRLGIVM